MIVVLSHRVRIRKSDARNWSLEVFREKKGMEPLEGEEPLGGWKTYGHYGQLSLALQAAVDKCADLLLPEEKVGVASLYELLLSLLDDLPRLVREARPDLE